MSTKCHPKMELRLNLAESCKLRGACDQLATAQEVIRQTLGCFGAQLNARVDEIRREILRTAIHGVVTIPRMR